MSSPRRVLLIIETSKVYGRGLLDGIGRYAMTHGQLDAGRRGTGPRRKSLSRLLRSWTGDGILSSAAPVGPWCKRSAAKSVPAIDTNSAVIGHGFPLVYADENRVGRAWQRPIFSNVGFSHFGFCSLERAALGSSGVAKPTFAK